MTKFYLVTTYTCYCGEHFYHPLKIEDGDSIEQHIDDILDWVADDAAEWWDDQSAEEFDGDYDSYLADCGYDIEEITESEYLHEIGI